MRFRIGLIIGFGAGYYFGTAAGRERHEQIKQAIGRIKRSDAYETATEKAKAAVDLTTERAKGLIEEHKPSSSRARADLDAIADVPARV